MGQQPATRLNCHQTDFSLSMPRCAPTPRGSISFISSNSCRRANPLHTHPGTTPYQAQKQRQRHHQQTGPATWAGCSTTRERLPPLMVLPSVFVSQSQTRRLTRFVESAVAVLEMPDFDAETTWLGLQVFYERLLEHGIADIALNQLRRSWIDNWRFPPQLPILWTAVEDGR